MGIAPKSDLKKLRQVLVEKRRDVVSRMVDSGEDGWTERTMERFLDLQRQIGEVDSAIRDEYRLELGSIDDEKWGLSGDD